MGEKALQKEYNSFWTIPRIFNHTLTFLRQQFSLIIGKNVFLNTSPKGFTLIELIIVIAVLGVLMASALFFVNPLGQLKKGRDAQRKHELLQLSNALENYYHDYACYPAASEIPWGRMWSSGDTVFMKEVPVGPSTPNTCYQTDTCQEYFYASDDSNACKSWYVVFAKKEADAAEGSSTVDCPLESLEVTRSHPNLNEGGGYFDFSESCLPENYVSGEYYCRTGGEIDCAVISEITLP